MAEAIDFEQFSVTSGQSVQNLTGIRTQVVSALLRNVRTGQVVGDFTGANTFDVLAEFKNRTPAQQDALIRLWAMRMCRMKAGIE